MTSGSFVRIAYCRSSTCRLRTASGPRMNTIAASPVSSQLPEAVDRRVACRRGRPRSAPATTVITRMARNRSNASWSALPAEISFVRIVSR